VLAEAGPVAVLEGGEDPVSGEEPGGQIGERHAGLGQGSVLLAGDADDPAHALGDQVVATAMAVGAGRAEAAHRAVDQSGVHRGQGLVADAQALGHPRPVVLDEDVGRPGQALDQLDARRLLEVDGQALLVAVDRHEARAVAVPSDRALPARRLALAGRLELDDLGPEIGEVHGAEGRGHGLGEVDDAEAGQGLHATAPVARSAAISDAP
jgi:hypothetical protein